MKAMNTLISKMFRVFCLVGAMCGISAQNDADIAGKTYGLISAVVLVWVGLYLVKDDPNTKDQVP